MIIAPRQHRLMLLAAVMAAGTFSAETATAKPLVNTPVYNPDSKSYMELVQDLTTNGTQGPNWGGAVNIAKTRYFKNVQGRLAVINSPQTDLFIATTFRTEHPTWFGLYYDCGDKKLKWSASDANPNITYKNFDPQSWNIAHNGILCPNGMDIMPGLIFEGKHWALQLTTKNYNYFIVEYPTGGVEPVKTAQKLAEPPPPPTPDAVRGSQDEE